MANLRKSSNFVAIAESIAGALAVKYKEEFPEILFSSDELKEIFFKRIMNPPLETLQNDDKEKI